LIAVSSSTLSPPHAAEVARSPQRTNHRQARHASSRPLRSARSSERRPALPEREQPGLADRRRNPAPPNSRALEEGGPQTPSASTRVATPTPASPSPPDWTPRRWAPTSAPRRSRSRSTATAISCQEARSKRGRCWMPTWMGPQS